MALPHRDHGPSRSAERARSSQVASPVLVDLRAPLAAVSLGLEIASAGMAVPETAVDKNEHALTCPPKVRSPVKRHVPSPARKSPLPEQPHHSQLRRGIAAAAHPRH
ncbi:MAG TPA: hypothetical protein VH702_12740 [Vicinamibacterales bacterium]